jgi:hypothetical protein
MLNAGRSPTTRRRENIRLCFRGLWRERTPSGIGDRLDFNLNGWGLLLMAPFFLRNIHITEAQGHRIKAVQPILDLPLAILGQIYVQIRIPKGDDLA